MNSLYLTQEGKAGSEARWHVLTQPAMWYQPWVVEVAQRLGNPHATAPSTACPEGLPGPASCIVLWVLGAACRLHSEGRWFSDEQGLSSRHQ